MKSPRTTTALLVAALAAALAAPIGAHANERAYPYDGPDGERYYLYAHGGAFPTGHGLQLWRETNGLVGKCSIPEGLPVGHASSGEGQSGLQVTAGKCNNVPYPADTRIL